MPLWECVTHVVNATHGTIIACVHDNENRPYDFIIEPGKYKKCKTKKGIITVSAFKESEGEKKTVRAFFSAHTSVIVREIGSNRIEIVPAKIRTIWTATEDGSEERTLFDSTVETIKVLVRPIKPFIEHTYRWAIVYIFFKLVFGSWEETIQKFIETTLAQCTLGMYKEFSKKFIEIKKKRSN
jgi:hypothetical protein